MCRGENEPRGPYRCSGDTARELVDARLNASKVHNDLSSARNDIEGQGVKIDVLTQQADDLRASLDGTQGDDDRAEIEARLARTTAAADAATERRRALYAEARKLEAKLSTAQRQVDAKRMAYDATPNGIADLSRHVNEAQDRYDAAIADPDASQDARIEAGTHLTMMKSRRDIAERTAKLEAIKRITNFESQADVEQRAREYERWSGALDQAREDRANAKDHDSMLVADTGIRNAEEHLTDIHRAENSVSLMNAWVGGYSGDRTEGERHAWKGISSIHKPIRGKDGRLHYRVELQRDVDGIRTRSAIELPDTHAIDYSDENSAGPDRGRYPTTAHVMRSVTAFSRAYEAAEGDRRRFDNDSGMRGDFNIAAKAHKALQGLLRPAKAPVASAS